MLSKGLFWNPVKPRSSKLNRRCQSLTYERHAGSGLDPQGSDRPTATKPTSCIDATLTGSSTLLNRPPDDSFQGAWNTAFFLFRNPLAYRPHIPTPQEYNHYQQVEPETETTYNDTHLPIQECMRHTDPWQLYKARRCYLGRILCTRYAYTVFGTLAKDGGDIHIAVSRLP
jgi:hypothetical protein